MPPSPPSPEGLSDWGPEYIQPSSGFPPSDPEPDHLLKGLSNILRMFVEDLKTTASMMEEVVKALEDRPK